jgi:uncharacterized membrane-anchored protein
VELEAKMRKIPQITISFWIMKICATTLGETAGDLLSMTMHVGYAISSLLLIGLFFVVLVSQLLTKKYHPFLYWMVILSTSTAGTTMSDYMDRTLGLGYAKGSFILCVMLLAIFSLWRFSTDSLSVKDITTFKVEVIYWTAILFSNTLGTALGDFLSDDSHLGFGGGVLLISGLLGLVILVMYFTNISRTLLFWVAFVLTRPFGATMGDLLTKTKEKGGFGFGTIGSSIILASILIIFILYTNRTIAEPEVAVQAGPFKQYLRVLSNRFRFISGSNRK